MRPPRTRRQSDRLEREPGDAGPQSFCDCTRPGTFRCSACASGTTPVHGRCPADDGVGCACDESVAIAAPGDCAHPEQFVCALSPDLDASLAGYGFRFGYWYAFADCLCDSTRPITASQCTGELLSLTCTTGYGCPPPTSSDSAFVLVGGDASDSARYACACLPPPVPIR
jgi:hypothetical protein